MFEPSPHHQIQRGNEAQAIKVVLVIANLKLCIRVCSVTAG